MDQRRKSSPPDEGTDGSMPESCPASSEIRKTTGLAAHDGNPIHQAPSTTASTSSRDRRVRQGPYRWSARLFSLRPPARGCEGLAGPMSSASPPPLHHMTETTPADRTPAAGVLRAGANQELRISVWRPPDCPGAAVGSESWPWAALLACEEKVLFCRTPAMQIRLPRRR